MQELVDVHGQLRRKRPAVRHEIRIEAGSLAATREEYHRMLEAAKDLRDERAFLLIKVFANTGIYIRDLGLLTVEAVRAGMVKSGGNVIPEPRIAVRLKEVSQAAGLASSRGTARSLQRFYRNTRAEIEAKGASDVDRVMADCFEREQVFCGWGV